MKYFSLFLLSTLVCQAAPPEGKPADRLAPLRAAAAECYATIRSQAANGLPSEEHLKRLEPFLTPELYGIIRQARASQQRQMKQHPDEKPDWIEGDLFSSLFEGVKQWDTGEGRHFGGPEAMVKVNLTYKEPGQPAVEWTDTLIFQQKGAGWRLDDIRMGGKWAFKAGDSLRARLPGGSRESNDHLSPDEHWQVTFEKATDEVSGITIRPTATSSESQTLFGGEAEMGCQFPTWVVWSPSGDKLAIRLGDSPRYTRTLVYRLVGNLWQPVILPEFYPKEKKIMEANGFRVRHRMIDAHHWQDAETLVVEYFGNWTKEDEGDGFTQRVKVRFDGKGKARVVGAVEMMPED